MKFSKLTRQREIGILAFNGSKDADLSDPQYDSRKVTHGSTFVAIKGFTHDGHSFIREAIEQGATTIVVEDAQAFSEEDAERLQVNRLLVEDSRKALAHLSEEAFGHPSKKLRLIGVTGTNGKTTTSNLIKQLLEHKGERTGLIGTLGVWIEKDFIPAEHTTPESRDLSALLAKMVTEGVTTCVMEVSSHSVILERISALDFDIAIFTNLTQDHLDFHKTMDAYARAKQQFFSSLKETAVAITNADDAHGAYMTEFSHANVHSYGKDDGTVFGNADIVASRLLGDIHGTSFTIRKRYSDEEANVASPLVGSFNVYNLLASISALYFGVEGCSLEFLAKASKNIEPVRGRFEQLALTNGAIAIIDYAHTPDALESVLQTIQELKEQGKVITVFGCGGDRDKSKRSLMGEAAKKLSDMVIVTSDNPRTEDPLSIINEILVGIRDVTGVEMITDRNEAITHALSLCTEGDIILIAGKGHEDYQIIGKEKIHFSDREVVEEWNNKF